MTIVEEILAVIGEYTPVVVDGQPCTNWGQIAAYALIVLSVYCLFRIIGKAVVK